MGLNGILNADVRMIYWMRYHWWSWWDLSTTIHVNPTFLIKPIIIAGGPLFFTANLWHPWYPLKFCWKTRWNLHFGFPVVHGLNLRGNLRFDHRHWATRLGPWPYTIHTRASRSTAICMCVYTSLSEALCSSDWATRPQQRAQKWLTTSISGREEVCRKSRG